MIEVLKCQHAFKKVILVTKRTREVTLLRKYCALGFGLSLDFESWGGEQKEPYLGRVDSLNCLNSELTALMMMNRFSSTLPTSLQISSGIGLGILTDTD